MRALFWGVDHTADPPVMTVLLVGRPHRYLAIEVERKPTTEMTETAAIEELNTTEQAVLDVMALDRVYP